MSSMQRRLHQLLEPSPPFRRWWEKSFDWFILGMILASVGSVILLTVESVAQQFGSYLQGFQLFATGVFTVEYVLRVYACTVDERYSHPIWGRIRFMLTPMEIVDLLAVAPFYLVAFFAPESSLAGAMLLFRMLRLLKLFRYSQALTVFAWVLRQKASQLLAAFLATGVLLIFSSSLVYFAERNAQPEAFASIPAAMWWGIITLTTVGYGDVSPVTPVGQIFGALTAVLGIGIVALPSGVLASGFIEGFAEGEEQVDESERAAGVPDAERCPHCGEPLR